METKTKKLVTAALFAALACVATMIIKFPSPLKGYLNIGDCIVLLCGWMLSPVYGFVAAGLGSGLAIYYPVILSMPRPPLLLVDTQIFRS